MEQDENLEAVAEHEDDVEDDLGDAGGGIWSG